MQANCSRVCWCVFPRFRSCWLRIGESSSEIRSNRGWMMWLVVTTRSESRRELEPFFICLSWRMLLPNTSVLLREFRLCACSCFYCCCCCWLWWRFSWSVHHQRRFIEVSRGVVRFLRLLCAWWPMVVVSQSEERTPRVLCVEHRVTGTTMGCTQNVRGIRDDGDGYCR